MPAQRYAAWRVSTPKEDHLLQPPACNRRFHLSQHSIEHLGNRKALTWEHLDLTIRIDAIATISLDSLFQRLVTLAVQKKKNPNTTNVSNFSFQFLLCLLPCYVFSFPEISTCFSQSSFDLQLFKTLTKSYLPLSLFIVMLLFPTTQFFSAGSSVDIKIGARSSVAVLLSYQCHTQKGAGGYVSVATHWCSLLPVGGSYAPFSMTTLWSRIT